MASIAGIWKITSTNDLGTQLLEWDIFEEDGKYTAITIMNGEKYPFVVFDFDGKEIVSSIVLNNAFGATSIAMDAIYDAETDTITGETKSVFGVAPFSGVRAKQEELHILFD